jgi:hypothetical protein
MRLVDGLTAGGRTPRSFWPPPRSFKPKEVSVVATTKAQEIYEEVEKRIAAGVEKADAFKALAEEQGRPYDSIRGSYYSHKKRLEGGESKPRTRRRETTPDDALADARAALERAIASIDREVAAADERAAESAAEAKALKASAAERKKAITERLDALK